ncbi:MAG TPA: alpha/beta fold hydrolase [Solirubrobacterales bacterium]
MPEARLTAGTIHYEDSGGEGFPLVLLHGLAMDSRLWGEVVPQLTPDFRCIAPTLPLGSHREAMKPEADLSLRGLGRLVAEFIESLGVDSVTLCFSDWSGAQPMVADGLLGGVDALILVSCETEGNYPPGLAGRAAGLSAKLPGGLSLMRQMLLRPWSRRLPFIYGQMSKRGVPDELMREWLEPLHRAEIRRDLRSTRATSNRASAIWRPRPSRLAASSALS